MNCCILGAGAWGTAMALHLDRCGHSVTLVPRRMEQALEIASSRVNADYLPGFELPHRIQIGYEIGPVLMDDAVVSSSRIRDMVQSGLVWEVRPLLGRFYRVEGQVVSGRNRGGRLLGFPTANLQLRDELFPKTGVYAVWAESDGRTHPAVANIGYNPTFGNDVLSVEVHILDFDQNIYDRDVRVHFVQRLRSEQKFPNLDALMARIREDIVLARRILGSPEAHLVEARQCV